MIIKEISIQNFKSFGNNKQTITFGNKGNLILLTGGNGEGKSSFQESIDYTLFGLVRGKEKKRIPQTELPNRLNNSLLTSIKFENDNGDDIYIERGLKPPKLGVFVNSNDITPSYKGYTTEKKERIIGMNYDIYKSFISMSLNDFTNFINLDPETKRKLLNKLFNLEDLDRYYLISKDIIKDNLNNISKIEMSISSNNSTILSYNEEVDTIKNIQLNNRTKDDIKQEILSKKSIYLELKEKLKEFGILKYELLDKLNKRKEILDSKNNRYNKIDLNIENIENKLKTYEGGECPLCGTILKSDDHNDLLDNLILERDEIIKNKDIIRLDIFSFKRESQIESIEYKKLLKELYIVKKGYEKISNEITLLKREYSTNNIDDTILNNLKIKIQKLRNENTENDKILDSIKISNKKYLILNQMFSVNGLRTSIIKNMIKPINDYLIYYLDELESPFTVTIDTDFNADIYERGINKIHSESLSSGESRKINIAIVLSYLEIIRKVRKCNLLFLDELFASVDVDNVDILLKSLRNFAVKYDINIVVVNHSLMDINLFDRIIEIKKDIFSMISEKTNDKVNV